MARLAAQTEGYASAPATAIANPAPLGLSAFALTTFILSAINSGIVPAGVTTIFVGPALFYGGIAQILAGMWEFRTGNTFGATAFTSYGAFWLSLGVVFVPGSGILAGIASTLHPALGIFLLGWTIFTLIMFIGTLRSNMALIVLFGLLFLTFLFLTLGEFGAGTHALGGYLGILTALVAWYTALAGLLSSTKSIFTLPVGPRD